MHRPRALQDGTEAIIAAAPMSGAVALAVAYFAGAAFGITLTQHAGNIAPFWPPNALLLTVLLRSNPRRWLLWLGTALLTTFAANIVLVGEPVRGAILSAANVVEVAASAELLRRATGGQPLSLADGRHLVAFAVFAGIVGPAIGATGAAGGLAVAETIRFWSTWTTWWIADAMGMLLFGPLFLSATRQTLQRFTTTSPCIELAAIAVISATAAYIRYSPTPYPLGFLAVPVFLWGAFRFGIFGCSLAVAIYTTITAWLTVHGQGLIARMESLDSTSRVQYIQMALATIVLSVLGVAYVVAQRERYAKSLQDAELRLRAIVDHAQDAYVAIDAHGRIVMWSPQAERTFGWPATDAIGRQLGETILPIQYREAHYRGLKRYLETSEEHVLSRRMELNALHRDGREFPVELAISTFEVNNERYFSAFIRDVGDRPRLEEMLRQTQKLEAIGRLAGGIAHTFNNLFQVVFGNLDLAGRRAADEKLRDSLGKVLQAAERGAAVTRQLLAFAREQPLNPQCIAPSATLSAAASLMRQSLPSNISIRVGIPADLWPIRIDVTELELALVNLGLNARDAMPAGGVLTMAAMNRVLDDPSAGLRGEYVVVEIADSGVGIPPEVLPRIFDPFFSTKDPASSRGLGLSQVHGFAFQSGGAVDVSSRLGQGTTFTLYLPAARDVAVDAGRAKAPSFGPGRKFGTVLIVEDDVDVAEVTAALLEECGFEAKLTYHGRAALDLLRQGQRVDVILSDIMMPGGITGMQLAEEVRNRWPEIPVLLATGYSEAAADAASRGLAIITKPYTMEELCASIAELIANREATIQSA